MVKQLQITAVFKWRVDLCVLITKDLQYVQVEKKGTEDSFNMVPFVEEAEEYICIYVYMCRCMFMCTCKDVTFAWEYREIL